MSADSSSASNRDRARRCYGVIERLEKAAASASPYSRNGEKVLQGGSSSHPRQAWVQLDTPGRASQAPGHNAELVAPTASSPVSGAKASAVQGEYGARGDDSGIAITHSAFCRFVEGKKFNCRVSLEGFLRTLSGTGRLLAAHGAATEEKGAATEEKGASQGQKPFSATTARRRISPVEGGSGAGAVSTSQFAPGVLPTKRFTADSSIATAANSRGRPSSMAAQAQIGVTRSSLSARTAARGDGGGGSSARSSGAAGYPSSRSGTSATPRGAADNSGGFLDTPRGSVSGPRGGGFVAEALFSFDVNGSGTLSSEEFISAANRVTGLPVRQEWGDVLAKRFAAGIHGVEKRVGASCTGSGGGSGGGGGGVRWLGATEEGGNNSRLDISALVDFLRPKSFSLSVMTPFGKISPHPTASHAG